MILNSSWEHIGKVINAYAVVVFIIAPDITEKRGIVVLRTNASLSISNLDNILGLKENSLVWCFMTENLVIVFMVWPSFLYFPWSLNFTKKIVLKTETWKPSHQIRRFD